MVVRPKFFIIYFLVDLQHLIVSVKNLSLCIEELLLLKLCAMFGPASDVGTEDTEESDFETQRRVMEATSVHAARYYFGILKLTPDQVDGSSLSFKLTGNWEHALEKFIRQNG